jgi:hypothetical protein
MIYSSVILVTDKEINLRCLTVEYTLRESISVAVSSFVLKSGSHQFLDIAILFNVFAKEVKSLHTLYLDS